MKQIPQKDPYLTRIAIAGTTLVFVLLAIIILLAFQLDRLQHPQKIRVVVGDSVAVRKFFDQDTVKFHH